VANIDQGQVDVDEIEARIAFDKGGRVRVARRSAAGRCTVVSSLGTTEGGHLVGANLSDGLSRSILLGRS
jgi:hypothetical protein